MTQIFRKKLFIEFCQKQHMRIIEVLDALKYWANELEGLTKEEIKAKNPSMHLVEDWFEVVEDDETRV